MGYRNDTLDKKLCYRFEAKDRIIIGRIVAVPYLANYHQIYYVNLVDISSSNSPSRIWTTKNINLIPATLEEITAYMLEN